LTFFFFPTNHVSSETVLSKLSEMGIPINFPTNYVSSETR